MSIKIKNNSNLANTMEAICDRMNLGYGALNVFAINEMASDSESMLAIFPDHMKPGAAIHHYNGGAVITMLRRADGWYISDIRINMKNESGIKQRLTRAQKAFLHDFDEMAA